MLKYVRSSKDIIKSVHNYNKSAEMNSENAAKYKYEPNTQKDINKDPTRVTYISKNFYSPKYG